MLTLLSANIAIRAAEDGIWGTSPPMGDWDPQGESEMDDLAAAHEVAKFIAGLKTDWTVFVEDQKLSIRQAKGLPKRWLADLAGHTELFKGTGCPGEFYVFQLGAFAAKRDIGKIGVSFGDLKRQHGIIGRDLALAGGRNPWRGICFGMTGRLGWGGDPQPMWKLWDEFGMNGTEMIGFWDPACPVRTGRDDILATFYRKQGKALVAIASWADKPTEINLQIDWESLWLDPERTRLHAPACERLQPTAEFGPGSVIPIEVGRGRIICID